MRRLLLALLLLPASAKAASAPPPAVSARPFLTIRTDPRFELLAMVQLLAGADRNSSAFFRHDIPYVHAAEAWFGPYARHPVVEKYRELAAKGFDYIELYTFVFGLTDPPQLEMNLNKVPVSIVAHAGGAENLKEFQLLLADFARVSRFQEFYDRETGERAALVAMAAAPARRTNLEATFRAYTGWAPPARETVIVSPFAEPVLSVTFQTADPDGVPRLTTLYGPEVEKGRFRFRLETRFAQMLLDAATVRLRKELAPYSARLERSAALYAPVGDACASSWQDCARRHIAFAVGDRLLFLQGSPEMAALWPIKYQRIGMPYLAPLIERLKEYESHREKYPTLTQFLPRMLDVIDGIAAKGAPTPPFLGRFGDSWRAPGPTAVILPGGPDAAAFKAGAEVLARRRPGALFLTDAEALKTDLKGRTLIVLGTPQDNAWLGRRWDDLRLPAHLEKDRIRFNPRPGEDGGEAFTGQLGYATTGLNPDDRAKPVLLYTGGSSAAALAALSFDPGLADYAVLQGTSSLKVGDYEKSLYPWRLK